MKYLLLVAALILTAPLKAEESICDLLNDIARDVMKLRQQGHSMKNLIDNANGSDMVIAIVQDAYKRPRWNSPESQQKEIEDFANDVYASCYSELEDK